MTDPSSLNLSCMLPNRTASAGASVALGSGQSIALDETCPLAPAGSALSRIAPPLDEGTTRKEPPIVESRELHRAQQVTVSPPLPKPPGAAPFVVTSLDVNAMMLAATGQATMAPPTSSTPRPRASSVSSRGAHVASHVAAAAAEVLAVPGDCRSSTSHAMSAPVASPGVTCSSPSATTTATTANTLLGGDDLALDSLAGIMQQSSSPPRRSSSSHPLLGADTAVSSGGPDIPINHSQHIQRPSTAGLARSDQFYTFASEVASAGMVSGGGGGVDGGVCGGGSIIIAASSGAGGTPPHRSAGAAAAVGNVHHRSNHHFGTPPHGVVVAGGVFSPPARPHSQQESLDGSAFFGALLPRRTTGDVAPTTAVVLASRPSQTSVTGRSVVPLGSSTGTSLSPLGTSEMLSNLMQEGSVTTTTNSDGQDGVSVEAEAFGDLPTLVEAPSPRAARLLRRRIRVSPSRGTTGSSADPTPVPFQPVTDSHHSSSLSPATSPAASMSVCQPDGTTLEGRREEAAYRAQAPPSLPPPNSSRTRRSLAAAAAFASTAAAPDTPPPPDPVSPPPPHPKPTAAAGEGRGEAVVCGGSFYPSVSGTSDPASVSPSDTAASLMQSHAIIGGVRATSHARTNSSSSPAQGAPDAATTGTEINLVGGLTRPAPHMVTHRHTHTSSSGSTGAAVSTPTTTPSTADPGTIGDGQLHHHHTPFQRRASSTHSSEARTPSGVMGFEPRAGSGADDLASTTTTMNTVNGTTMSSLVQQPSLPSFEAVRATSTGASALGHSSGGGGLGAGSMLGMAVSALTTRDDSTPFSTAVPTEREPLAVRQEGDPSGGTTACTTSASQLHPQQQQESPPPPQSETALPLSPAVPARGDHLVMWPSPASLATTPPRLHNQSASPPRKAPPAVVGIVFANEATGVTSGITATASPMGDLAQTPSVTQTSTAPSTTVSTDTAPISSSQNARLASGGALLLGGSMQRRNRSAAAGEDGSHASLAATASTASRQSLSANASVEGTANNGAGISGGAVVIAGSMTTAATTTSGGGGGGSSVYSGNSGGSASAMGGSAKPELIAASGTPPLHSANATIANVSPNSTVSGSGGGGTPSADSGPRRRILVRRKAPPPVAAGGSAATAGSGLTTPVPSAASGDGGTGSSTTNTSTSWTVSRSGVVGRAVEADDATTPSSNASFVPAAATPTTSQYQGDQSVWSGLPPSGSAAIDVGLPPFAPPSAAVAAVASSSSVTATALAQSRHSGAAAAMAAGPSDASFNSTPTTVAAGMGTVRDTASFSLASADRRGTNVSLEFVSGIITNSNNSITAPLSGGASRSLVMNSTIQSNSGWRSLSSGVANASVWSANPLHPQNASSTTSVGATTTDSLAALIAAARGPMTSPVAALSTPGRGESSIDGPTTASSQKQHRTAPASLIDGAVPDKSLAKASDGSMQYVENDDDTAFRGFQANNGLNRSCSSRDASTRAALNAAGFNDDEDDDDDDAGKAGTDGEDDDDGYGDTGFGPGRLGHSYQRASLPTDGWWVDKEGDGDAGVSQMERVRRVKEQQLRAQLHESALYAYANTHAAPDTVPPNGVAVAAAAASLPMPSSPSQFDAFAGPTVESRRSSLAIGLAAPAYDTIAARGLLPRGSVASGVPIPLGGPATSIQQSHHFSHMSQMQPHQVAAAASSFGPSGSSGTLASASSIAGIPASIGVVVPLSSPASGGAHSSPATSVVHVRDVPLPLAPLGSRHSATAALNPGSGNSLAASTSPAAPPASSQLVASLGALPPPPAPVASDGCLLGEVPQEDIMESFTLATAAATTRNTASNETIDNGSAYNAMNSATGGVFGSAGSQSLRPFGGGPSSGLTPPLAPPPLPSPYPPSSAARSRSPSGAPRSILRTAAQRLHDQMQRALTWEEEMRSAGSGSMHHAGLAGGGSTAGSHCSSTVSAGLLLGGNNNNHMTSNSHSGVGGAAPGSDSSTLSSDAPFGGRGRFGVNGGGAAEALRPTVASSSLAGDGPGLSLTRLPRALSPLELQTTPTLRSQAHPARGGSSGQSSVGPRTPTQPVVAAVARPFGRAGGRGSSTAAPTATTSPTNVNADQPSETLSPTVRVTFIMTDVDFDDTSPPPPSSVTLSHRRGTVSASDVGAFVGGPKMDDADGNSGLSLSPQHQPPPPPPPTLPVAAAAAAAAAARLLPGGGLSANSTPRRGFATAGPSQPPSPFTPTIVNTTFASHDMIGGTLEAAAATAARLVADLEGPVSRNDEDPAGSPANVAEDVASPHGVAGSPLLPAPLALPPCDTAQSGTAAGEVQLTSPHLAMPPFAADRRSEMPGGSIFGALDAPGSRRTPLASPQPWSTSTVNTADLGGAAPLPPLSSYQQYLRSLVPPSSAVPPQQLPQQQTLLTFAPTCTNTNAASTSMHASTHGSMQASFFTGLGSVSTSFIHGGVPNGVTSSGVFATAGLSSHAGTVPPLYPGVSGGPAVVSFQTLLEISVADATTRSVRFSEAPAQVVEIAPIHEAQPALRRLRRSGAAVTPSPVTPSSPSAPTSGGGDVSVHGNGSPNRSASPLRSDERAAAATLAKAHDEDSASGGTNSRKNSDSGSADEATATGDNYDEVIALTFGAVAPI